MLETILAAAEPAAREALLLAPEAEHSPLMLAAQHSEDDLVPRGAVVAVLSESRLACRAGDDPRRVQSAVPPSEEN